MRAASEFTVKRIDAQTYELWRAEQLLATLTREEAWPVMMGQVHPSSVLEGAATKREQFHEGSDPS